MTSTSHINTRFTSTLECHGIFSRLFILKQNLIQYILKMNIIIFDYMMRLMKINLQNKNK